MIKISISSFAAALCLSAEILAMEPAKIEDSSEFERICETIELYSPRELICNQRYPFGPELEDESTFCIQIEDPFFPKKAKDDEQLEIPHRECHEGFLRTFDRQIKDKDDSPALDPDPLQFSFFREDPSGDDNFVKLFKPKTIKTKKRKES